MNRLNDGYVKAQSDNLPSVDMFMILELLKKDDRFSVAEIRGVKETSASREDYGDSAIGYVQLKRSDCLCTLQARVCPEHKVRDKPYTVVMTVDENEEAITELKCLDCAAAAGGCKHALALLMWSHRESSKPARTSVNCYWKKPLLSRVGSDLKYLTLKDLVKSKNKNDEKINECEPWLEEIWDDKELSNVYSLLNNQHHPEDFKIHYSASMHRAMVLYTFNGGRESVTEYCNFLKNQMNDQLLSEIEEKSRNQALTQFWFELRYGRITASKLYEAANCKTDDGALVKQILGAVKLRETNAIERGRHLEKEVIQEVEKRNGEKISNAGLFLNSQHPVFGASPDGLTKSYVVEIKCPSKTKTISYYMKDGKPTNKFRCQILLQMLLTGKKKGCFCVAAPDFEISKEIEIIWVDYNEEYLSDIMARAFNFWKSHVFPKLFRSASPK